MNPRIVASLVLFTWLIPAGADAQPAEQTRTDDELKAHLAALGERLANTATEIGVRERLAMEMAATLDRAAISAPTAEDRRARWTEAVEVLDRFSEKNAGHLQEHAFRV